jgi:dTMP kinase
MFISFEGTEGVGKSTLIKGVAEYLKAQDIDFIVTREPGGTPLAEQIRGLLLTPDGEVVAPACELLLLFAARAQHLSQIVEPALARGQWVLCDRFVDASFAYQCGGRGLPSAQVQALVEQFVTVLPTKTFWLDAPVSIGMARAGRRGALDRFEQEKHEFFERVRAVYAERAIAEPERIVKLDATLKAKKVLEATIQALV